MASVAGSRAGRAAATVPGGLRPAGGQAASLPHPATDFFVCDVLDALPKADLGTMEHPMFSLGTRPDLRILDYAHNDTRITVTPSVRGLATIHDKDILIYCISQLMAAINRGRPVARVLDLKAHDLLTATNRETSGDGYHRLREAFERLAGTRITTNIVTDGLETTSGFGLIEGWQIVRHTKGGRMVSVSVTLSEWLFRAVLAKSVLTLSRDYFRLRKPLERRVYELARKHCGRQPEWRVSVEVLLKKSGSASPRRVFRRMIRDMIDADTLPEYRLEEEPGDILRVTPRREPVAEAAGAGTGAAGRGAPLISPPQISPEAHATARSLAPGADVHALEAEWRHWWATSGRVPLRSADAAFVGWVKGKRG